MHIILHVTVTEHIQESRHCNNFFLSYVCDAVRHTMISTSFKAAVLG